MNQSNPLMQYYRQVKSYISLPGGQSYYEDGVVDFTDNGEVGVMSMTGADEIVLKNPDALLNGEAVKQVLNSCVVGLHKVEALLSNDVDVLLAAIQGVSYKNSNDILTNCPKCEFENKYGIDTESIVASAEKLESEYFVNLSSGATVFIRPFTFKDNLKATAKSFEQAKTAQALEDEKMTDQQKLAIFSKSFKELTKLNYELLASSIVKIIDQERGLEFLNSKTNEPFIKDMLLNIDASEATEIHDKVKEINNIGIAKTLPVQCQNPIGGEDEGPCKHEWDIELDLNPVNFFTAS